MENIKIYFRKIILILLTGLIIRLALVIFLPYPSYPIKVDDARGYDILACNILKGNGFSQMTSAPYKPDIIRTPGYPFFLAIIYFLFGRSYFMVRLIQAFLDIGTCFLAYLIARKVFPDNDKEKVAILALILSILAAPLAFLVSAIYTETLSAFLITLSIYFAITAIDSGKFGSFFLSALTMGYSILVRPVFALLPLIIAILWLYQYRTKFVKQVFCYLIVVFLMIIPWTIRNYVTFHRFVPLAMGFKLGLYKATWPSVKTEDDLKAKIPAEELKTFSDFILIPADVSRKDASEILKQEEYMGAVAIKKIKKDIPRYLGLSLERIGQLWVSSYSHFIQLDVPAGKIFSQIKTEHALNNNYLLNFCALILKVGLSLANIFYLFFGILGLVISLVFKNKKIILILFPIFYISFLLPFLGHNLARYSVPAWPVFIVCCAYGLMFILKKFGLDVKF